MDTGGQRNDGRGRHTTTHRELVPLAGGAMLIDTPGIRGVGVVADADALDTTFADVAASRPAAGSPTATTRATRAARSRPPWPAGSSSERRFDSWRRLAKEAAYQARRSDARLAAQERDRWKARTKEYHRGMRGPRHPRNRT